MSSAHYDAAVIGAGPAGLITAISLASTGCSTVIAGPPFNPDPSRPDTRTTALLQASVRLLRNTGVWDFCAGDAAALRTIRLIDSTGRLLRAPEVTFDCAELGGEPFGYNIPNTALVAALYQRARAMGNIAVRETAGAEAVVPGDDAVTISFAEGDLITAALVAGADGRKSLCRTTAGIGTTGWTYPQKALAFNFDHSEPHEDCSNEFHCPAGPFTTVPLPGRASSLVWVETHAEADRLLALPEPNVIAIMEDKLQGLLGTITAIGPRAAFPLTGMTVNRYAASRIALVGEAAHVIPPIGAQGLNLGFRDAAALAECVSATRDTGGDPGNDKVLRAYDRARRADVSSRTFAVDLLNRSLISGFVPLHAARGLGLHLLNGFGPLRRFFMREGLAPQSGLPKLMQPSAPNASAHS